MDKLLEKYPYATDAVRDWFMGKMIESFKDQSVPAEFKEFMRQQGVSNDRIAKILGENPRVLFDVFDDNNLIINIIYTDQGFTWDVEDVKSIQYYPSRREAEGAAVERTFRILDERLNIIISETKNNEGPDSTTSGE
jgi:hypothetical protein